MSALNLPKPVHSYAGEDELRKTNGGPSMAAAVEDAEDIGEYRPPRMSDKYKDNLIYPPGEIRKIVDKTAAAVAKTSKGSALEDKIRESQKTDPRFAFLNDEDPYHQYYMWKVETTKEEMEDIAKGIKPANGTPGSATPAVAVEVEDFMPGYEPKVMEFKVDLPGVTAQDLDILRLTALFQAHRGRSFLEQLSKREGRNYQFDFLRPTHSLYGYYNRMVESYQKVMQPPAGLIDGIVKADSDPEAKWKTLEEARKRAQWERGQRKREDEKAKERDEEAVAYSTIDWQDFVTVETIEFTQADVDLDLPPPTSIDKLRQMSMAEKRMASMIMEEPSAGGQAAAGQDDTEEIDMEEDDEDEETRLARIKAEQEQQRARDVQRAALESKGLKIKKDYVPKGIQRAGPVATSKCPYCGQSIPENEYSEHIRIESLDPRWKQQRQELDARRHQASQLQMGADISASLKNMAAARTDIFGDEEDEATRKRREEEDLRKKRDREKIIWDGHTNSASKTENTFQSKFAAEDARRRAAEAAGTDQTVNTVGPQAGPGIVAQPQVQQFAPPPQATTAASISAGPTRPSAGASMNPARAAMLGSRPAPDAQPTASAPRATKRARVDKLPAGQLYSEIDWMSLHPSGLAVTVQLPTEDKAEWKLDGSVLTVPDVMASTTFGALRERIKRTLDADLPVARMKLEYGGKMMNNGQSLASVNLAEGDVVVLSLRKK